MSRLGRIFGPLASLGTERVEKAGLRERRKSLLADLRGDVLEVGAGAGLNLDHYPPGVRLVLVEPDPYSRRRLQALVDASEREATVIAARAEELPLPDGSFDAVVSTLVLCSVGDLEAALGEIRRVLRPDGRLVLIEHVRGQGARAVLQELVAPASRLLLSCSPNRRTAEAVRAAGFELVEEPFELRGSPAWTRPAVQGNAARTG
jgi:ubiquinone/menaquinone biosynthesis C-methylase UbiE